MHRVAEWLKGTDHSFESCGSSPARGTLRPLMPLG